MVQQRRQIQTKRWTDHVCAEHQHEYEGLGFPDPKCTGRPLPGFTVGDFPVCRNAAMYHVNMEFRKHRDMLETLANHPQVGGRTKERANELRIEYLQEVPVKLAGGTSNVANLNEVLRIIADYLARVRFTIAGDLFEGAKTAAEALWEHISEGKRRAVESIITTAESDLQPANLNPTYLNNPDRMAYWGAAKRSMILIVGDPKKPRDTLRDKLQKAAGVEGLDLRREFLVRQIQYGYKVPREQAEAIADQTLGNLASILHAPDEKETPLTAVPTGTPESEDTPEPKAVKTAVTTPTPSKAKSGNGRRRSRKGLSTKVKKPKASTSAAPNGGQKRAKQKRRRAAAPTEEGDD